MKITFNQFYLKTNRLDKILIFLIFFFPLFMSLSIFLADLSASIISIFVIFLLSSKKERHKFNQIKKSIYVFLIFYAFILISLIFSISIEQSLLPSIFYIRYFLFILGIFYFLEKYEFMETIILYSILFTFLIVALDSFYQFFFLKNILNYPVINEGMNIITSFFNDEKKLGSYSVRLLPFILSLLIYLKKDKLIYPVLIIIGMIIFLASERTALFLFFVLLLFFFLINKYKIKFAFFGLIFLITLLTLSKDHRYKYLTYTLQQFGVLETKWNSNYGGNLKFYSQEHENLAYSALQIFKKNILTGSGIKTFYLACNELKSKITIKPTNKDKTSFFNRNNQIKCSTHPHNYYLQILSDSGIFLFLIVFSFFLHILIKNIKLIFKKDIKINELSYYFLNIGIIINLFPLIPSGNFYNNWLSLIMFYPLGFWLYINQKIKDV